MLLVSSKDFDHLFQHVVVAAGIAERRYRGRHCGGRDVRCGRRMYDTMGRQTMEDGRSMTVSGLFKASVADGENDGQPASTLSAIFIARHRHGCSTVLTFDPPEIGERPLLVMPKTWAMLLRGSWQRSCEGAAKVQGQPRSCNNHNVCGRVARRT
jgi:hypothetical protein